MFRLKTIEKRKVLSENNLGIEVKLIDKYLEIRKISDPEIDPWDTPARILAHAQNCLHHALETAIYIYRDFYAFVSVCVCVCVCVCLCVFVWVSCALEINYLIQEFPDLNPEWSIGLFYFIILSSFKLSCKLFFQKPLPIELVMMLV